MADGYFCDKCGKAFRGKEALSLTANVSDDLLKKLKVDFASGEYCIDCAPAIFKAIPWSKEDEE